jgi:hypothetical protein
MLTRINISGYQTGPERRVQETGSGERGWSPERILKKMGKKTKKVECDIKKFPIISVIGEDSHSCDAASPTMPTDLSRPPVSRSPSREGDIPS